MRKNESSGGFTLLEVVVSITILALLTLMITRIFNQSTSAMNRGNELVQLDETARLLLNAIEQDIGQALVRTNVPFRVRSTLDLNDTIYVVSTGIRRQHETIPRDTGPMRIRAAQPSDLPTLNRYLEIETPDTSSDPIDTLMTHSEYYFNDGTRNTNEFGAATNATFIGEYTLPADQALADHAVLTFLEFSVNANTNWSFNASQGTPLAVDMPRFVDVVFGLISATEMKTAIQLDSLQHLDDNQRIFSRRISIRNQGL